MNWTRRAVETPDGPEARARTTGREGIADLAREPITGREKSGSWTIQTLIARGVTIYPIS
jgi:hypothetical protein